MYGYIYKTIFPNGMIYIGQKKGTKVDGNYYGSGSKVSIKIKEIGKHNLKRDILDWCETPEELNEREKYWIDKLNSRDSNIGYNLSIGGEHRSLGCKFSEESRKRMGDWQRGKKKPKEACENMSRAQYEYAKKETPEHKKARVEKFKETMQNKPKEWKEEYGKRLSKSLKGKTRTPEQRKRISEGNKGKAKSENHKIQLARSKSQNVYMYSDKIFLSKKELATYLKETENLKLTNRQISTLIQNNGNSMKYSLKYKIKLISKESFNG
jgi:hypothetical protein